MLHAKAWLKQSALWKRATMAGLLLVAVGAAQGKLIEFQFTGELTTRAPIAAFLQFEANQLPSSVAKGPGPLFPFTDTYTYDALSIYRGRGLLGTDLSGAILQRDSGDPGLSDLYSVVSQPMGHGPWITAVISYLLAPSAIVIDPINPQLTLGPMTDPGVFDGRIGAISLRLNDGSVLQGSLTEVTSRAISEPATMLLLAAGFGGAGLFARRLRRRSR